MVSTNEIRFSTVLPRRTRLNVKQSKNGCFSCRAQRKKCDEEKPSCLRCIRSGRECGGYANRSPTPPGLKAILPASPCQALATHVKTDYVQSRFLNLGIEVLAQETCRDSFGISAHVWTLLLPQVSSIDLTVNAAVAALGATYEAIVLRPDDEIASAISLATKQYHKALASLQSDILVQHHGPTPLFLASLLLAAVEVLMRHLTNALMHLRGAFAVLTECMSVPKQPRAAMLEGPKRDHSDYVSLAAEDRPLYLIAQALDIQTTTYALSRAPDLPMAPFKFDHSIPSPPSSLVSLNQAHSELVPLLHACYHHTSVASPYKYLAHCDVPSHIALEQGRYVALLSQWISKLDLTISSLSGKCLSSDHPASSSERFPLLVLKIQCISAIIYLSTIMQPRERAYDSFLSFFQQIVDGARETFDSRLPGGCLTTSRARFRMISPISQPLFLTAMKCRQGAIRRRAINLLSQTGREGPWYASVYVRIAQRAVEIEEQLPQDHSALLDLRTENAGIDAINVQESVRLHGCGVDSDGMFIRGSGFIEAHFSRCVDVERMLTRTDASWDSKDNWEMWTERMQL